MDAGRFRSRLAAELGSPPPGAWRSARHRRVLHRRLGFDVRHGHCRQFELVRPRLRHLFEFGQGRDARRLEEDHRPPWRRQRAGRHRDGSGALQRSQAQWALAISGVASLPTARRRSRSAPSALPGPARTVSRMPKPATSPATAKRSAAPRSSTRFAVCSTACHRWSPDPKKFLPSRRALRITVWPYSYCISTQ